MGRSWAWPPLRGRPGLQLGATLPAPPRTVPGPAKPRPAGHPPTRLCCTGGEVPEARSTQAACSNTGQTAGWIFHGGSQTKALGSVFLKK